MKKAFVLLIAAALMGSAGAAKSEAEEVRIAGGSHLDAFDPQLEVTSLSVAMHIYDTLVDFGDENYGSIVPSLAERWDNSEDGLTWTFYLKKGVKFSDGSPFNADSVKFTLERILDPKTASPNRAKVAEISKVDVVDDYIVKITTRKPYAPLLENLATYHLAMLSRSATSKYSVLEYGMKPVGTGPYMLESYDISGETVLVRNPNYYGTPGTPDRISYTPVPEVSARVIMLQTGEVDIATGLSPESLPPLEADPNIEVISKPSTMMVSFTHQMWKGAPYDNKLVRQAMMYAVDREAIVKTILGGYGVVPKGPFSPGVQAFADFGGYEYNPEKAKELLAEAGYPNGFSTIALAPEGRYMKAREVSEAVQGYLAQVGINVELKMSEWATYVTEFQSTLIDRGMHMLGSSIPTAHWRIQRIWGTQKMPDKDHLPPNTSQYSNPEVDRLLSEASQNFSLEERNKLYAQAEKIVWEDAPELWLFGQSQLVGVRKGFSGYKFYGNQDWRLDRVVKQ
ncbi:ABC transporter substrate-binding protein [Aminobacter ciceronei]|uniref:Peptide/nickel transport system substrate-binding protein n=1 Tax=Aminobacter ciceronei TaxID=150723 RepID=A0ABR6C4B3_9HYPH|nr:ABC transporter substrate-binding protein [Aminobacter ciceronei]MBA8906068.1 peptide/nickel transport system substrate-binding protein [Aminobacter ciceronei]MBA9019847.1 peptide/nickel transport system substrate-binding protein [Aminobacter ciceronei]